MVLNHLIRKKNLHELINEESQLGKVLNTVDLTAIGVGCTLGVGIYVLPGSVARDIAGPGVIYSFFLAAITSVFAGLCFAEFGARVPKAGSAYTYSYVTVGEFIAFIIGWSLIMEYIIGTASVAKGLSVYIDSMIGFKMESFYKSIYDLEGASFLSEYFDILAFIISLLVTVGLATGLKESMTLNNVLTFVNISVVLFVIIAGSFKADIANWRIPENEVPAWAGEGGFLPYGVLGTIAGASTCFFGYVGFDAISASGEEVKNPQKAIPFAIILSLAIVFFAYFGVSSVLTLMWPYYLQNPEAPLPYVFSQIGWPWAQWIVAVGGVFGLMASLIGGMFPLPRIIYAMANDGLLFRVLGKVSSRFKTPFVGTIVSGLITGVMAAVFKLKQLVDLMSIGTLLAYTIVAGCVLILRYKDDGTTTNEGDDGTTTNGGDDENSALLSGDTKISCRGFLRQVFNSPTLKRPSRLSETVVTAQTLLFGLLSAGLASVTIFFQSDLISGDVFVSSICGIVIFLMGLSLWSINCQPFSTTKIKFKVPFVPLIPGLSIFCNIYLMILMDGETWIRFLVWLVSGLLIYFGYGIFNSSERKSSDKSIRL